jgi:hypothetical protein
VAKRDLGKCDLSIEQRLLGTNMSYNKAYKMKRNVMMFAEATSSEVITGPTSWSYLLNLLVICHFVSHISG